MTQELKLADDLFEGLLDGSKQVTIRSGDRDIKIGPLVFSSVDGSYDPVEVDVILVTKTYMHRLSDDIAQMDGADTVEQLFEDMKRFYPTLTWDSVITIVTFERTNKEE